MSRKFHGLTDRQVEHLTCDFRTAIVIIRDKDTPTERREVYAPGPMFGRISASQGRRIAENDYEGISA